MNVSIDGSFTTSVYTRAADTGLYTNFKSCAPDNYKASVVKTLVVRAKINCTAWNTCYVDLDRLRQVFVNNGYPQNQVYKIVEIKMGQHLSNEAKKVKKIINSVDKFFRISNSKKHTRRLNQIVGFYVRATELGTKNLSK